MHAQSKANANGMRLPSGSRKSRAVAEVRFSVARYEVQQLEITNAALVTMQPKAGISRPRRLMSLARLLHAWYGTESW
jgi:hypothetical protein